MHTCFNPPHVVLYHRLQNLYISFSYPPIILSCTAVCRLPGRLMFGAIERNWQKLSNTRFVPYITSRTKYICLSLSSITRTLKHMSELVYGMYVDAAACCCLCYYICSKNVSVSQGCQMYLCIRLSQ